MNYKENMTKEEFIQAMEEMKEGLFTEEELQKRIQSETDKVRTEYSKKVKELQDKIPAEKSEQELALEAKEEELKKLEKSLTIKSVLQKHHLPEVFSKYLDFEDAELFEKEIAEILNGQMLQNSYKPKDHKPHIGISKEQFRSMNYAERMELSQNDPVLFETLMNNDN